MQAVATTTLATCCLFVTRRMQVCGFVLLNVGVVLSVLTPAVRTHGDHDACKLTGTVATADILTLITASISRTHNYNGHPEKFCVYDPL